MKKKVKTVGLVIKPHAQSVERVLREIMEYLAAKGISCVLEKAAARKLGLKDGLARERIPAASDLVVVLGGDGTLLSIAHHTARASVPILGINMGRLGFLTEIPLDEVFLTLDAYLAGNRAIISPRRLLEVRIKKGVAYCLNDLVINKGALARMIEFTISIDGHEAATLKADGLIISTTTGSTAYSLSAGGPIIHPQIEAAVITPICPHTLSVRPMIIPSSSRIRVKLLTGGERVFYTLDGQRGGMMNVGDTIEVARAPFALDLISSPRRNYFDLVKEKLGWAE